VLHIFSLLVSVVMICVVICWIGLRIPPKPFPRYSGGSQEMNVVDHRVDLPAPVDRFFRQIYAEKIPVIQTANESQRTTN